MVLNEVLNAPRAVACAYPPYPLPSLMLLMFCCRLAANRYYSAELRCRQRSRGGCPIFTGYLQFVGNFWFPQIAIAWGVSSLFVCTTWRIRNMRCARDGLEGISRAPHYCHHFVDSLDPRHAAQSPTALAAPQTTHTHTHIHTFYIYYVYVTYNWACFLPLQHFLYILHIYICAIYVFFINCKFRSVPQGILHTHWVPKGCRRFAAAVNVRGRDVKASSKWICAYLLRKY